MTDYTPRLFASDRDVAHVGEGFLTRTLPREEWTLFSHLLIFHGREICQARKPKCSICPLLPHCPAGQKFVKAGVAG